RAMLEVVDNVLASLAADVEAHARLGAVRRGADQHVLGVPAIDPGRLLPVLDLEAGSGCGAGHLSPDGGEHRTVADRGAAPVGHPVGQQPVVAAVDPVLAVVGPGA